MSYLRLNRRRLLEGMAAAPLAIGASLAHAQSESGSSSLQTARAFRPTIDNHSIDRLGWKLSSQAWTFRDLTIFETLDVLNALGLRYIEFFPGQRFSPENPTAFDHNSPRERIAELQKKLKSARVTPVNYGVVGLNNNEAQARKVFDFAKALHLETIVSEPSFDSFPLLDRLCGEYKINVACHDHPKPDPYWSPDTVLRLTHGLSRRVGACADTGHWYRSGLVPLDCLKQLKGRIISLHFKDLNEQKTDVPWGTGVCDARGMLEEMKRQGFRGVFSIEYESGSGPELVRNVSKCIDFFSRTAVDLAKSV